MFYTRHYNHLVLSKEPGEASLTRQFSILAGAFPSLRSFGITHTVKSVAIY